MKKIILAGMVAMMATTASAGTILEGASPHNKEVTIKRLTVLRDACIGGAVVFVAGSVACGLKAVTLSIDKDVQKTINKKKLAYIKRVGGSTAFSASVPFVHVGLSSKLAKVADELIHKVKENS